MNIFFKKILSFLKSRISRDDFLGLSFTVLVFLILYVFIEYIGITDSVLDGEIITKIDTRLSEFFFYFKDKRLIDLFLLISYLGNYFIILLISLVVIFILFLKGKKFEIIGFIISTGLSSIIVFLSKDIISRPRPELAVYNENLYSFPSFHATIAVSLYGFIIWLLLVYCKRWKYRIRLIILGIVLVFLIGFSRLYLNVHYLSDVISGWFLGSLGLILGITIVGYLNHIYGNKIVVNKKNNVLLINISLILLLIISTINYNFYYKNIEFLNFEEETFSSIEKVSDIFYKNKHLRFTETLTGRETEPINFIFIAKDNMKVINLFNRIGWHKADRLGRHSIKNMGEALLIRKKYETAPITPLYWNKEIQTYAFQKLTREDNIKFRHHIRVWKTYYKIGEYFVFVGTGIYDNGLKWGITHKIDPNIDKEREFILNDFKNSGLIENIESIQLEKEFNGKNFSGDDFFTDGKAYIIKII